MAGGVSKEVSGAVSPCQPISQFVVSETITREAMKSRAGSSSIVWAVANLKLEEVMRSLGLTAASMSRVHV